MNSYPSEYSFIPLAFNEDTINLFPSCYLREPVKKKVWKIPHLGGGPDQVIYHTF